MNQAAILDAGAFRRRLAAFAWVLLARQVARAVPDAAAAAAGVVAAAMLFLVILPRALFGAAWISAPLVLAVFGTVGALAGAVVSLRRARKPDAREAALALEARIGSPSASLATAVDARDPFATPVLERAAAELETALAARGPQLYSSRTLLVTPAALLVAALVTALAWQTHASPPDGHPPAVSRAAGGLAAIDTGSDRATAADTAQAMGMSKAAAALQAAAEVLLQREATAEATNSALREAKEALANLHGVMQPGVEIPETAPALPGERAALAEALNTAARGLSARAEHGAGTTANGNLGAEGGLPEPSGRVFAKFPAPARESLTGNTTELAGQSPARRALVQRALEASK